MNTLGQIFRLTTFGESHGPAIGGVMDGFPAGIPIDLAFVQQQLDRRRPGQSALTTARRESDRVEILSGVFEGVSTGTPIGFIVRNSDQHSADYDNLRDVFRPSHADYTYQMKYGVRDHRGGGRSSARETVSRVVAGAFAMLALRHIGVRITAYTSQVGPLVLTGDYRQYDFSEIERNPVRCPEPAMADRMAELIRQVKAEGDTIGGVITCIVEGCPVGLGEPVFGKLHADLGAAMLSINAAKGFEYGEGFAGASGRGSEQNDLFLPGDDAFFSGNDAARTGADAARTGADAARTGSDAVLTSDDAVLTSADAARIGADAVLTSADAARPRLATNHSGGIQGGISNGEDIVMRIAFKPVATLLRPQTTIDRHGQPTTLQARGRHDPCVLPRAVPIVEAMAAITILDHYLRALSQQFTGKSSEITPPKV